MSLIDQVHHWKPAKVRTAPAWAGNLATIREKAALQGTAFEAQLAVLLLCEFGYASPWPRQEHPESVAE